MPITDPCVIRLGAESGCIRIHGHEEPDGSWRFIGSSMNLDVEEDGNDSVRVGGIPWCSVVYKVLPAVFWTSYIPLYVHPELWGWFRDRYEAARATLPYVRCHDELDEIAGILHERRLQRSQAMFDSTPPDQWSLGDVPPQEAPRRAG